MSRAAMEAGEQTVVGEGQWREVGTNGPFDALLAECSGHLCAPPSPSLGTSVASHPCPGRRQGSLTVAVATDEPEQI